ncbi:MAG: isoprenylcysteine carboxylmethyltransferase family protein [Anaerolineales bacterium]
MTPESIFGVAFWILFAGVFVMRIYFTLKVRRAGERVMPDREAVEREGRGMFAVRVILGFILLGWLVLYAINPTWMRVLSVPFPDWLRWIGFALGLASLGFWSWTQVALGKEWSPQLQLRKEHHLVTTGPYARIRHPLYTAMFGYGTSLALVTANWFFIVFAIAIIAGLCTRVPKEEEMMIKGFGEEYKAYMQRTGRFFPK